MPEFADDPNLQVFTGLMSNARFAPLIPGWEEIAQITSDALQRIYLGEGEVQADAGRGCGRDRRDPRTNQ